MLAFATGLPKVECVAFTPDGGRVVVGGRGLEMWDRFAGERVWQTDSVWARSVFVAAAGRQVLAVRVDRIDLIEIATGTPLAQPPEAFTHPAMTWLAAHPPSGGHF